MQKVIITSVDDIDGTNEAEEIGFSLDGATYEIDLASHNAGNLRALLAPYIKAGRSVSKPVRHTPKGKRVRSKSTSKVREWAIGKGYTISMRGRIPETIQREYEAEKGAAK